VPRPTEKADLRLLSKVSKLYYEQELHQREIAEKLHLSRAKVSRLLQQARDYGIVQITILPPHNVYADQEERLEKILGLSEVVIVDVSDPESQAAVSHEIGVAAAEYLKRTIRSNDIIGLSWGTTLQAMASAIRPTTARNIHIVQLNGGLGPPFADTHATNIARRFAQTLDAKLTQLPVPGIVDDEEIKKALMSDRRIADVFRLYERINVAFGGIGAPTPDSVLMRDGSIINREELDQLLVLGAVGDIALRFMDNEGRLIPSEIEPRVVGITEEQLKGVPRVVGIAGGQQKAEIIQSALKGGWLDVLITDHRTAEWLLAVDRSEVLDKQ
jgi:DNA-binding transcriptional regulator LsrR (DeoR family)